MPCADGLRGAPRSSRPTGSVHGYHYADEKQPFATACRRFMRRDTPEWPLLPLRAIHLLPSSRRSQRCADGLRGGVTSPRPTRYVYAYNDVPTMINVSRRAGCPHPAVRNGVQTVYAARRGRRALRRAFTVIITLTRNSHAPYPALHKKTPPESSDSAETAEIPVSALGNRPFAR